VHNHTNEDLSVTCKAGFDGGGGGGEDVSGRGRGQRFHLEVRDRETGRLVQNQSSNTPEFTVR
jgi:hypothetical protein